jgi:hypothetical protein
MMEQTLNSYFAMKFSNPDAPRVIVYPNKEIAASLLNLHKSAVISVADCIDVNAATLPMPDILLPCLDERIKAQSGRVAVVGIDPYLALLSKYNRESFFEGLRGRIDDEKLNALYLVSYRNKPDFGVKYEESLSVISIGGDYLESINPPEINIVSNKWVNAGHLTNFNELLKHLGDFMPEGSHTLVLRELKNIQTGLGDNVTFYLDARSVAKRYYGFSADFEINVIETLLTRLKESGKTAEEYLESEFGKTNINIRLAVKRLCELSGDDIWAAYLWLLQNRLPKDSYLSKVLQSAGINCGNLLRKYVVDVPMTVIDDANAEEFADERAEAIKTVSAEALIVEFIEQAKDHQSSSYFLNCGTEPEQIEIVRRVSELDLTAGIPKPFRFLYPALSDYLAENFDYGISGLNAYFKEYRKRKIASTVTEEFMGKVVDSCSFLTMLPQRDSVLLELKTDDTALLVIDGMGAEYLPLLLALAKRQSINVESYSVALANMPTTTEYNRIQWDEERKLNEVKSVDDIAHYGAVKNEFSTPERNIAAVLRVFETEVLKRIAEGLSRFPRLVVTADHGSSRLAVVAHNAGLGTTLPWDGQPLDWRFSLAPEDAERSKEFEQQYHPSLNKSFWIVRGYNRLPKPGPKLYELHGGASPEERLVPIVVFTKAKSAVKPIRTDEKKTEQIVDRMGFDI